MTMENNSHFAPAERSTEEQILKEFGIAGSHKLFTEIFGAMTGIGALLNSNRQIIYVNDDFLKTVGVDSIETLIGQRPGEILSCQHSDEGPAGCGTSKSCNYCGVVHTILESQSSKTKVINEAHITTVVNKKHINWDLKVISTPINLNGSTFYLLVLQDISESKRRAALERIFFHDLLNSIGGLYGLLSVLKEEPHSSEQTEELINLSEEASRNIIDEILLHRQLRDAENGELKLNIESVDAVDILDSAITEIGYHKIGKERMIKRDEISADVQFETDKSLMRRIIINLLKNALEATEIDGVVTAGVSEEGDDVIFWVKNKGVMPEEVQTQMFNRSFTTKGEGRGLGTYSIRLLTENYLLGEAGFRSNEKEDTIFTIRLKKKFPE
jgi:K+-sensing histidine kinase KdpD